MKLNNPSFRLALCGITTILYIQIYTFINTLTIQQYAYYYMQRAFMSWNGVKMMEPSQKPTTNPIKNLMSKMLITMMIKTLPSCILFYKIGWWNMTMAMVTYVIAALLLQTPIERNIMNESRHNYIPRYKRWNRLLRMRNSATKLLENIEKSINKYLHQSSMNYEKRRILKYRMKVAKQQHQATFHYRQKTILAVSTILAMSAKGAKAQQQTIIFDTDSKPVGIDN